MCLKINTTTTTTTTTSKNEIKKSEGAIRLTKRQWRSPSDFKRESSPPVIGLVKPMNKPYGKPNISIPIAKSRQSINTTVEVTISGNNHPQTVRDGKIQAAIRSMVHSLHCQ